MIENDIEKNLIDKNNEIKHNKNEQNEQIYFNSNFLSKLFFYWTAKIIKKDIKSIKKEKINICEITNNNFFENFLKNNKLIQISHLKFIKYIFISNFCLIFQVIILSILTVIFQLFQYIFLRKLMNNISKENNSDSLKIGIYFIIIRLLYNLSNRHLQFLENYLSVIISNQIIFLIINKSMKIYNLYDSNIIGKIINFIQFDCENISFIFNYGPSSLIVPIQVFLYFLTIYNLINRNKFIIMLLTIYLIVILIIGYIIQKLYFISNNKYLSNKDNRIKLTNDLLNLIREIKENNYEEFFYSKILQKRKNELIYLNQILNQGIANNFIFFSSHIFLSLIIFNTIIYFINPNYINNTSNILTIIFILSSLSYPLYRFPVFITGLVDAFISIQRICTFLNNFQLNNLNIHNNFEKISHLLYNEDKFICILGKSSSGKSTLFKEIILKKNNNKNISYCSQENLILNLSIKNNILFGNKYDDKKFNKVIELIELKKDLDNIIEGENKKCGFNGNLLSGGQKARINIGRAIYNESEIYLFDNIFSGLDEKVTEKIYQNIIEDYLKNKKKFLILNNINFLTKEQLKKVDKFIILDKYNVIFEGNLNEFLNSQYYNEFKNIRIDLIDNKNYNLMNIDKNNKYEKKIFIEKKNKLSKIHKIEIINIIKYLGVFHFICLILFPILYEIFEITRVLFISNSNINFFKKHHLYNNRLKNYFYFSILSSIFLFFREYFLYQITYNFNIFLHNKMLSNLLYSPINSFHDKVSNGEKINHLNQDLEKIKYPLKYLSYILRYFLTLILTIFICTYFSKISLLSIPIMFFISIILLKLYLNKFIEFNHLERKSKSPLINTVNESINSSYYLKSFNKESVFINNINKILNNILKNSIIKHGIYNWYNLTIELFGILYIFILINYCIFNFKNLNLNKSFIGLLISYSVNLIENIMNLFENIIKFYIEKVPLDRCDEYIYLQLEQNNTENLKDLKFLNQIDFQDISMRYDINSEIILKNVNFCIKNNEKIAIIGRTGSGKTSLILALLRIIQGNKYIINGNISIDNIDINKIDLYYLRDNLSIVSQFPLVFEGTLKENLDPKNLYTNEYILNKIKENNFFEKIYMKIGDLKNLIKLNELSFSEKQLICIFRAILKNKNILIFDEATANIDINSEKIFYDVLNKISLNKIIISIIHKLDYINYFNRIFIVNNGKVYESKDKEEINKLL